MSVTLTRHNENKRRCSPNRTADILVRKGIVFSAGLADRDVRGTGIFKGASSRDPVICQD